MNINPEVVFPLAHKRYAQFRALSTVDVFLVVAFQVIHRLIALGIVPIRRVRCFLDETGFGRRGMPGLITLGMAFLTASEKACSATNYVFAQQSLQLVINSSAANDTIVVFPGVALEPSIVINIPLTLVGVSNNVTIISPIRLGGSGESRLQQLSFANTVTIQSTGTVSLVGCTFGLPVTTTNASILSLSNTFSQLLTVDLKNPNQSNFQAFDSKFSTLKVTGGKALLKRCEVNGTDGNNHGILLAGSSFDAIRMTNTFGLLSQGQQNELITLLQCVIGTKVNGSGLIDCYNNNVRMGFCRVGGRVYGNSCHILMIGNIVVMSVYGNEGVFMENGRGELMAYNNVICSESALGVLLSDATATLWNDTIYASSSLSVRGGSNIVTMKGVALSGAMDSSTNIIWDISDCAFGIKTTSGSPIGGIRGCNGCGDLGFVSPTFASLAEENFFLKTNSVLIGNGPPEAAYNNRGTTNRSDIGYTGGPFLNRANYTNDNPLVYLLTGEPRIFTKGPTNTILVNAAAVSGD